MKAHFTHFFDSSKSNFDCSNIFGRLILFCFLVLTPLLSFAQSGWPDFSFNPNDGGYGQGDGVDNHINATALQSDSKIIIVGEFTTYNSVPRRNIARLLPNGNLDTTFNPGTGANGPIRDLVLQPDGKILICGEFTNYNGVNRRHVARINADGSLDVSFNSFTGANWPVFKLLLQTDGKVIIGGEFSTYNGTARNRIARLTATGSLDTGFNPGTGFMGSGFTEIIKALTLQTDGKILVGGDFSSYNGTPVPYIVRLNTNGTLDATLATGAGPDGPISAITVQPDGKLILGGLFNYYDNYYHRNIIRVTSTGLADPAFVTGSGCNNTVYAITLQMDGKIIIHGEFTAYDGVSRKYLARLNTDGSLDMSLNAGTGPNTAVNSVTLQSDGKLILAGWPGTYNDISFSGIARISNSGVLETTFNQGSGANDEIRCMALQSDGKILIGGVFKLYNNRTVNRIARLWPDGTLDTTFIADAGSSNYVSIDAIAIQSDGKFIVGGNFAFFNGVPKVHLVRLNINGTIDATFNTGSGPQSPITALAIQPDGKILIGGMFDYYNGVARNKIARVNANGSLDLSFNPGTGLDHPIVKSIVLQPDGRIIVAGLFQQYNGIGRIALARALTNGALDTSFSAGVNLTVTSVILLPDSNMILAGEFTMCQGVPRRHITRVSYNGAVDTLFTPGAGIDSIINTALLLPDGKILIAGNFTMVDSIPSNRIARLNANGTRDSTFVLGVGANKQISTATIQPDGNVLIAGFFTAYNSYGRNRIARVINDITTVVPYLPIIKKDGLLLYPNPTRDKIWVECDADITQIVITDMQGRVVYNENMEAGTRRSEIDTKEMMDGIYFIQLRNGNALMRVERLVKVK